MESLTVEMIQALGVPITITLVIIGMYRKQIWGGLTGANANKGMEDMFAKNLQHFEQVTVGTGIIIETLKNSERHLVDILGVQRKLHEEVIRQGAKK
jgi:hypothetical protein